MTDQPTENQIRDADAGLLDAWIAQRRDLRRVPMNDGSELWDWRSELPWSLDGVPDRFTEYETTPPYASEWWAAGNLVDDLDRADLAPVVESHGDFWIAEVEAEAVRFLPEGDSAPEAIARAYLLAAVRGLLDE